METPLHTADHTWYFKSALFQGRHLLRPEAGWGGGCCGVGWGGGVVEMLDESP